MKKMFGELCKITLCTTIGVVIGLIFASRKRVVYREEVEYVPTDRNINIPIDEETM